MKERFRECPRAASAPPISAIVNPMVQYPATVDRAFAALGDPTRRAVLERLGSGSATTSELAEPFGMSLTGMKKHIRLLEEAELVTTQKVGRVRRCMLAPYAFEGITTWLQRLPPLAPGGGGGGARHDAEGRPCPQGHARALRLRGHHHLAATARPLRAGRRTDERSTMSPTKKKEGFSAEERAAKRARAK